MHKCKSSQSHSLTKVSHAYLRPLCAVDIEMVKGEVLAALESENDKCVSFSWQEKKAGISIIRNSCNKRLPKIYWVIYQP